MGLPGSENFTQPYAEGGPGGAQQRPAGAGDNGQTWDPIQKRWVPQGQMPAGYDPAAGSRPVDANGNPLNSDAWANSGGQIVGGNQTVGRVQSGPSNGGNIGQAWGGYSGTIVKNPDGTLRYDQGLSGRQADVDRLRGLADASANAQAPQINYGNANGDNMNGAMDRSREDDAIALAKGQANGGMTPARDTAWKTLHAGEQAQVAGAMSRRGGPLAQVSAMRTQQEGAAAYNQKGANQIAALRADEMEQGRNTLAGLAAQERSGDVASQYNNANQTINQGNIENAQRDLNQRGQMGFEEMGSKVNIAAQGQAVTQKEQEAGVASNNLANQNAQANQDLNTAMTMGDSVSNVFKTGAGGGQPSGGVPMSDCRAKRRVSIADYLGRK